jgi:hypothetical protein
MRIAVEQRFVCYLGKLLSCLRLWDIPKAGDR